MTQKEGLIIWLNGCSSVGKGMIIQNLIPLLKPSRNFFHIGIDHFLPMFPSDLVGLPQSSSVPTWWRDSKTSPGECEGIYWIRCAEDPPVFQIRVGSEGKKFFRGYFGAISALAKEGNNIIVDDVLFMELVSFRDEVLALHRVLFPRENLLMVRLSASLEVVEKRERERGDRVIGQARGHFSNCHVGVEYDLEFDVSEDGCSNRIAREISDAATKRWPAVKINLSKVPVSALHVV